MVLDKRISFDEIKKLALKTESNLLKSINVFDLYEGESIGKNKKSYSISFILQDKNQTLKEKAIDHVMQKLIKSFEDGLKAIIRK